MNYLLFIVGLVFLIKGADFFVEGSSKIAERLKIPKLIIGLTIVAFGTSAPEAAVSILASIKGQNDIAIANVIGSNVFNLLATVGIVSIIRPMGVHKSVIIKELPFAILACFMLFVLSFDNIFNQQTVDLLDRADGLILLMVFGIFIYSLIIFALNSQKAPDREASNQRIPIAINLVKTVGGLVCIILGGRVVVDNAVSIAQSLNISESIIGLTIVAAGTSLPELVTSLVAIKKGESDIALGNVVGSNIFNIFFVLGISAAIAPLPVSGYVFYDVIIMTVVSIISYIFAATNQVINRKEGACMVVCYLGYLGYILIR